VGTSRNVGNREGKIMGGKVAEDISGLNAYFLAAFLIGTRFLVPAVYWEGSCVSREFEQGI
jgi:hypothetical protein